MWDFIESACDSFCEPVTDALFSDAQKVHDDDQKVQSRSNESFYDARSIMQSSVSSWSDSDAEQKKPISVRTISFRSASFSLAPLEPAPIDEALYRDEYAMPYDEKCSTMGHAVGYASTWEDTASYMTPRENDTEENESLIGDGDEQNKQEPKVMMTMNSLSSEEELPFDESFMKYDANKQTLPLLNRREIKERKEDARRFAKQALYELLHFTHEAGMTEDRQDVVSQRTPLHLDIPDTLPQKSDSPNAVFDIHVKKALTKIKTTFEENKAVTPILRDLSYLAASKDMTPTISQNESTTPPSVSHMGATKKYPIQSALEKSSASSERSPPTERSLCEKLSPSRLPRVSRMPSGTLMATPRRVSPSDRHTVGRGSPSSCESTVFAGLEDSSIDFAWPVEQWENPTKRQKSPLRRNRAVVVIQRTFRGYLVRKSMHARLETLSLDTAALIIQAAWLTKRARRPECCAKSTKTTKMHNIVTDTILLSDDGCEILFGSYTQPIGLQRTPALAHPMRPESLLACRLHRCPSPCDDEEDLFFFTAAHDGESETVVSDTSPPRKEFNLKRMAMVKLPCILEEDPTDIQDGKPKSRELEARRIATSPESSTSTGGNPLEQELAILNTASWGSSELVPPPRLRRKVQFPGKDEHDMSNFDVEISNFQISRVSSSPIAPPSLGEVKFEGGQHFASPLREVELSTLDPEDEIDYNGHLFRRVFGVVELAVWLQAVARGLYHRRRYLSFQKSIICIQSRFRQKRNKPRSETCIHKCNENELEWECCSKFSLDLQPISLPHQKFRSESTRPPLYPEIGSSWSPRYVPSPRRGKGLDNFSREEATLHVPFLSQDLEEEDFIVDTPMAVSWPVPDTHYHHRTQFLGLQKASSFPSFERSRERTTSATILNEVEKPNMKTEMEVLAADWGNIHPWSDCHSTLNGKHESSRSKTSPMIDRRMRLHTSIFSHKRGRKDANRHRSAIVLQRFLRDGIENNKQSQYKEAAVQVQRIVRGFLVRKVHQLPLHQTVKAQAIASAYHAMHKFTLAGTALIMMQSVVKMFVCRTAYSRQRCNTITLQKVTRMLTHRRAFLRKRSVICRIQSVTRMWLYRRKRDVHQDAALEIQCRYRGYTCQAKFKTLLAAVVVLQAWWRRKAIWRRAATKIQCVYRGMLLRRRFQRCVIATHTIQRKVRQYQARNRLVTLKQASVAIQRIFRGRVAHQRYDKYMEAVVVLQSHGRRRLTQQRFAAGWLAVLSLQRFFRGITCRVVYEKTRWAVVTVQAVHRRRMAQRRFNLSVYFATRIQAAYRGRNCRLSYDIYKRAIVAFQSSWRRHHSQKTFASCVKASTQIQRIYRSKACRLKLETIARAAVTVQALERRRLAQHRYDDYKQAALKVQTLTRGMTVRKRLQKIVQTVVVIQKNARRWLSKQRLLALQLAALRIQAFFRGCECRKLHRLTNASAVTIQKFFRAKTCIRLFRKKRIGARRRSKVALVVHRLSKKRRSSAVRIQNFLHTHQMRLRYRRFVRSIVLLQSYARMTQERKRFLSTMEAVFIIQSFVRCYARRNLDVQRTEAIQNALLLHVAAKQGERVVNTVKDVRMHHAAIIVQTAFRKMLHLHRITPRSYGLAPKDKAGTRAEAEHSFEVNEIEFETEDCAWFYTANQCMDFDNDDVYCPNVQDFSALFEDRHYSAEEIVTTGEPNHTYQTIAMTAEQDGTNRLRSKRRRRSGSPPNIVYAMMVSVVVVGCVFHSLTIQPANATSSTAVQLQLRALRSQIARTRGQASAIGHVIQESLFHRPMLPWTTANKFARENKPNFKTQDEYEKLYQSHLSSLQTVRGLQATIRSLLENASLQNYQARESRNRNHEEIFI